MFMGMFKMVASRPSAFSISFRLFVSSVLIAPINGAATKYVIRKIDAPKMSVIQLGMFRKITIAYVSMADKDDARMILIDD